MFMLIHPLPLIRGPQNLVERLYRLKADGAGVLMPVLRRVPRLSPARSPFKPDRFTLLSYALIDLALLYLMTL